MKNVDHKLKISLVASLAGMVLLPLLTISVFQILIYLLFLQSMDSLILYRFDGDAKELYKIVSIVQGPTGAILGAFTGYAFALMQTRNVVTAHQICWFGGWIVFVPTTCLFLMMVPNIEIRDLLVLLPWLGLPLFWATLLIRWSWRKSHE